MTGIRFKSFDTVSLLERGIRTLDVFLTALEVAAPGSPAQSVDPLGLPTKTGPLGPPAGSLGPPAGTGPLGPPAGVGPPAGAGPLGPSAEIGPLGPPAGTGPQGPSAGTGPPGLSAGTRPLGSPAGTGPLGRPAGPRSTLAGLQLTFPKVTAPEQVSALCDLLEPLEDRLGLHPGSLRFELQIETTESIFNQKGQLVVPRLIAAGRGRVTGLHFGTYDYTAACGLDAAQQHLEHSVCDFARHVMQVSAANAGIRLSDGSTNVLPVGDAIEHGWRTHYRLVRRSLEHGFPQSWDLHPAQLVTRYAAVFAYYREIAGESARRLGDYLSGRSASIADEPATARALARTLRRAVDCGALAEPEVTELVGTDAWRNHA